MVPQPIAELAAGLAAVEAAVCAELSDAAMVSCAEVLLEVETRLRAVQTRLFGLMDGRDVTTTECGRGTVSWLAEDQRLSGVEAGRRVRLARWLPAYPATRVAFEAAQITAEHALAVVTALRGVPLNLQEAVEAALLDIAREAPPVEVARAVEEIRTALGDDRADADREKRAGQRSVNVAETFAGTGSLSGTLTAEVRELFAKALAAAGASDRGDPADSRTAAQRRHDATGQILGFYLAHADTLTPDAGERPRIVVTIDYHDLTGRLTELRARWGRLDSGVPISPATARRLACDAQILPAVLGSRGQVLNLGRTTRTWTRAQRRAAWTQQHGRCAYPHCRRRPVELHHIQHWADHGRTDLDNAAWLCAYHHWLVHEGRWTIHRDSNGDLIFTNPHHTQRRRPQAA